MKLLIVGAVASAALCTVVPVAAQAAQHSHSLTAQHRGTSPVLINQANLKQLRDLPGVGARTAQRIIDYRKQHGAFKSVNDLSKVRGISARRVKSWGQQVRL